MRYEVLNKYEPTNERAGVRILPGTPFNVRIFPDNTDLNRLFVAIVQSDYSMKGTPALGGWARLCESNSLSEKEAREFIEYDSKRSITDKILRRPDNRIPIAVRADYINGRAVKLQIYQSKEVSGAYDMATFVFEREVGSVDRLFKLTQKRLESL